MLQSVTSSTTTPITQDSSSEGAKHPSIQKVLELELLEERTPKEWLPTHYDQYSQRIQKFEQWICDQEENVIAIVGHSQYFRSMLGLKSKFQNVDVWQVSLDVEDVKERHENGNSDETNGEKKDDSMSQISNNNDDSKEPMEKGIVKEVDGIRLEDLNLPQGWSELKHLYRYDPDYTE